MSNWYYADADRQRQGPLSAEELTLRFHQGKLRLDTLVWRDGLGEWQPLREFTNELALHQAPTETFYTPVEASPATAPPAATASGFADSPYAPPTAALTGGNTAVLGGEVVYAGFWKRVAASIIDSFVTGITTWILVIPIMLLMGVGLGTLADPENIASTGAMLGFQGLLYLLSFLVPCLYFGWMHSSTSMASLGKMAVGIKMVRGDGERASFWRSFLRYLAMMVFGIVTCYIGFLIIAFMVAMTERKQGLHDIICDTLVVDKWAFTNHPEWQKRELGVVTIVILSLAGVFLVGAVVAVVALFGVAASGGKWN